MKLHESDRVFPVCLIAYAFWYAVARSLRLIPKPDVYGGLTRESYQAKVEQVWKHHEHTRPQ